MISYELDVAAIPSEEGFDIDRPTRQTELLSLELRKILAGLSALGYVITQRQPEDEGGVDPALTAISDAISSLSLESSLTGLEDVISDVITELSDNILLAASQDSAIYVYDKVVYSKSGLVRTL